MYYFDGAANQKQDLGGMFSCKHMQWMMNSCLYAYRIVRYVSVGQEREFNRTVQYVLIRIDRNPNELGRSLDSRRDSTEGGK